MRPWSYHQCTAELIARGTEWREATAKGSRRIFRVAYALLMQPIVECGGGGPPEKMYVSKRPLASHYRKICCSLSVSTGAPAHG